MLLLGLGSWDFFIWGGDFEGCFLFWQGFFVMGFLWHTWIIIYLFKCYVSQEIFIRSQLLLRRQCWIQNPTKDSFDNELSVYRYRCAATHILKTRIISSERIDSKRPSHNKKWHIITPRSSIYWRYSLKIWKYNDLFVSVIFFINLYTFLKINQDIICQVERYSYLLFVLKL